MDIKSKNYIEFFIQEVKDFKELSEVQFFIKYCISPTEEYDLEQDYNSYSKYKIQEDELTYNEWLEEVYHKENKNDIYERVLDYRSSYLEVLIYKTNDEIHKIYELTLTFGGPNIYITIYSRWNKIIYEFYWRTNNFTDDLSYMYEDIYDYLNIDTYN